jgi:hypothetical protein
VNVTATTVSSAAKKEAVKLVSKPAAAKTEDELAEEEARRQYELAMENH